MLRSADIRPDTYKSGHYLRRWVLVDGQPRCPDAPLDTTSATADEIAAVQAANAIVEQNLAAVEAYEEALALVARVEALTPPLAATVTVYGIDGMASMAANPAWDAYQDAKASVVAATDRTKAYALVRRGCPAEPAPEAPASAEWTAYQQAVAAITAAG